MTLWLGHLSHKQEDHSSDPQPYTMSVGFGGPPTIPAIGRQTENLQRKPASEASWIIRLWFRLRSLFITDMEAGD